jgi:alpha-1,6-mannosyltransferase
VLEAQACGLPCVGISGSFMDANVMVGLEHWARSNTPTAVADAVERFSALDLPALGLEASAKVHARFSWQRVFTRQWDLYSRARLQGAAALHGMDTHFLTKIPS